MTKIRHIRSLRDIKNVSQSQIYSIPKQQRSVHLDLHVLAQEGKTEKRAFPVADENQTDKKTTGTEQ